MIGTFLSKYILSSLELEALGVPNNVARSLVRSIAPKLKDKASLGNYKEDIIISVYGHLGCYKDTPYWWDSLKRSIPSIEGKYPKVTGDYRTRKDPIGKYLYTILSYL